MANSNLRVASFNIRFGTAHDGIHSWRYRSFATTRLLKQLSCDVIGLQEAYDFQIKKVLKRLNNFEYVGDGRDGSHVGEHSPILFRTSEWKVLDTRTQWYGDTPDISSRLPGAQFPRIFTVARLISPTGQRVDVINTHLDHKNNELRQQSMAQLLQSIDSEIPTIIMGDFNAERDNKIFSQIIDKGLSFALASDCGSTDLYHFSHASHENAIDHIIVSNHFNVVSADVMRKRIWHVLASDHWPIVAELQLKANV